MHSSGSVHSTRTDWAPSVLVSLQPLKSWRWRTCVMNALCNWVDWLFLFYLFILLGTREQSNLPLSLVHALWTSLNSPRDCKDNPNRRLNSASKQTCQNNRVLSRHLINRDTENKQDAYSSTPAAWTVRSRTEALLPARQRGGGRTCAAREISWQ